MQQDPIPADVLARRDPDGADFPGRGRAEVALGLAIILFLAFGLFQGITAIASPGPQRRLAEVMRWDALIAGRTAAVVNQVMAQDLPIDPFLRAAGGVLRWQVFGSGGTQVAPGCDNWLFLTEEIRPWPDGAAAMISRAALLADMVAHLDSRGVILRVAVVPDKARMVPDGLCGVPYAAQAARRLAAFEMLLAARGIATVDLVAPLTPGAALFHRTDTHWNQEGARRAAAALAAALPDDLARETEFRTEAAPTATDGPGDLLRLMSLERMPDWLRPRADREFVETTTAIEDPAAEASILDDTPVPEVVLLGSSFSRNSNFAGALQQAARLPVANLSRAGGGFAGAAREFFGSPAWRETPPRVILWEFPERVLTQPLGADDRALRGWLDGEAARGGL
jgi:alginate O-acetyltransferase complex protein AlgJ